MESSLQKPDIHAGAGEQQRRGRNTADFLSAMSLSVLFAVFLLGSLIYFAGPWNIIANTRLLDVLIKSGIIKYHDRNAGFIEGVADHIYYLKSQEPVEWLVVFLVVGIIILFWVLKAFQFHSIVRYHGIAGSFDQHARAYLTGLTYKKFMPLYVSDAATTATLQGSGATPDRIYSALFLFRLFVVFEIAAYAIFGLLGAGWSAWLVQMIWALVVFGVFYWCTRPSVTALGAPSIFGAAKAHARELLQRPGLLMRLCLISLLAFGMLDVSAYLLTMAFSTQQVLLHVDFGILLMAFVSGYIARQIPLTPGGVGQFEWGFTAALFLGGMGLPEAATVALLFSFFYYLSFGIFNLIALVWRGTRVPFRSVLNLVYNPLPVNGKETATALAPPGGEDVLRQAPAVPVLRMPPASTLWSRAQIVAGILLGVFFFDRLTVLLSDLWLLNSLELHEVFSTNFRMGAILFGLGALLFGAGVAVPALLHPLSRPARRFAFGLAGLIGLVAGHEMAMQYQDYLLWRNGLPFGEVDPVFGRDTGFYVFSLPGLWVTWRMLVWLFIVTLISSAVYAHLSRPRLDETAGATAPRRAAAWLGAVSTPTTLAALAGLGVVAAAGIWLSRYNLLIKEDYLSSVFTGADYIDVNGLFSTLNEIRLTAFVMLAVTAALTLLMRALHQQANGKGGGRVSRRIRMAGLVIAWLIAADFAFAIAVSIRDTVLVTPNQPVIQLPYIERHIAATRHAFGMDKVEVIDFVPRYGDTPLPDLEKMLASNTVRNASLWPTFVNYLEPLVDPQHAQRILQTRGDKMIYGPSLEIFRQQEKLRTYYNFLDVDVLRYTINGQKTVLASSVRELPILEPQPWLAWWGQRFMLFTHGHGLVMAPVGQVTDQGEPLFVSGQIPVQAAWPELTISNQQVYYGEGNASMAVSNVRDMAELDYPTEQGRAENVLPPDFPGGVKINSLLKRIVFGWRSGEFWEMIFSSLITPETRVHFYRQPLKRLERVAPFLYYESDPYATIAGGDITWLVNAVTISDQYPYSKHEFIGDKSLSRSAQPVKSQRVNYVEDAVKATINAATGQVRLYKIADKPVINTWAAIYPSLFVEGDKMPQEIRQQLTYPLQLFHLQFDDLYIYYHMNDPMYFFNMEDMWDDADEVLGPVMDQGRAITFSMEPYHMLLETGGLLPAAAEKDQFVMMMAFTPEGARNLRAMPIAYQDGEDYGRLFVLTVPKGLFIMGPEQADAIIDQDPDISQQISWWNRRGTEVIRGHTSLMLIDNEVIYVEPVFIRSQQNAIPQLKRVVVVLRGHAYMSETIENALRMAYQATGINPQPGEELVAGNAEE